MLFPVLKKLQSSYPDYIINTFDEWLGTRRLATIKTLSPLQFSTDTGIDDNVAINLFFDCCKPDIELLRVSWHLECPCCGTTLQTANTYSVIEHSEIFCENCSSSFLTTDENIFVWFSRLKEPDSEQLKSIQQRDFLGNSLGGKTTSVAIVKLNTSWDNLIQDI